MKKLYLLKKIKHKKQNKKAFTLVEVIVAMFVFVLVIAGSTVIFASIFKAYQTSKHLQANLENSQYAMNLMSKTFRTSSVVNVAGDGSSVTVFNYSRNECVKYVFSGGSLVKQVSGASSLSTCSTASFGAGDIMASGNVTGKFDAIGSVANTLVGRVTISMTITSGNSKVDIQTTTSLRDYGVSNITL